MLGCGLGLAAGNASAQRTATQPATMKPPVTDSSAQASPLGPALETPATDHSAQASPSPSEKPGPTPIPAHTALRVSLTEGIDSGHLKNGQSVHARLVADTPLARDLSSGGRHRVLRAGTPALLTVVGTVPAGKINAVGEISLELIHVGNTAVETETLTFRGKPGHRDLPDSAPEVGTNAGLHAGMTLTFHVQPPPSFGDSSRKSKTVPGSVTAVVSGSKSASNAGRIANRDPNQMNDAGPEAGNLPSGNSPPQPAQNTSQPGASPTQTVSPAMPAGTAQPH